MRTRFFGIVPMTLILFCLFLNVSQADEGAVVLTAPHSTSGEPALTLNRAQGKLDAAFSLSAPGGLVTLKAYNAAGAPMATLLEENLQAGSYDYSYFFQEFSTESGPITVSLQCGTQDVRKVYQP
jgi:hypothetical protein